MDTGAIEHERTMYHLKGALRSFDLSGVVRSGAGESVAVASRRIDEGQGGFLKGKQKMKLDEWM